MTELQKNNGFDNLGSELLAVLYIFQMMGSIIGASIVSKIGLRMTSMAGFLCLSAMTLL